MAYREEKLALGIIATKVLKNICCACSILLIGSILRGSEKLVPSTVVELIAQYDNTPKIEPNSRKTFPPITKGSSDSHVDIAIEKEKEGFRIVTLDASQKYQRSVQDMLTQVARTMFGKTFVPSSATASFFPHVPNSCEGTVVIAIESKVTVYDTTNRYHDIDAALNPRLSSNLTASPTLACKLSTGLKKGKALLTKAWSKSTKKSD